MHFAIGHPPHMVHGSLDGGLVDRVSKFADLPSGITGQDPAILDALRDVASRVGFVDNSVTFNPPVEPHVARRVGDAILDKLGARIAA